NDRAVRGMRTDHNWDDAGHGQAAGGASAVMDPTAAVSAAAWASSAVRSRAGLAAWSAAISAAMLVAAVLRASIPASMVVTSALMSSCWLMRMSTFRWS